MTRGLSKCIALACVLIAVNLSAGTETKTEISCDAAVAAALLHTPGWVIDTELETENQMLVYEVKIIPKQVKPVEIIVDARTGAVLGSDDEVGLAALAKMTKEEAVDLALKHTSGQSKGADLEVENCKLVYEVKIVTGEDTTVEILVDATTGTILGPYTDP